MDRDNQRRRLHSEDDAKAGLAFHDALIWLRGLGQGVRLIWPSAKSTDFPKMSDHLMQDLGLFPPPSTAIQLSSQTPD
jgi:hypothetical protein